MTFFSERRLPACERVCFSEYAGGVYERSGVYTALFCEKGSAVLGINGKELTLEENGLYIVTPALYFYITALSADCAVLSLRFSPAVVKSAVSGSMPVMFSGDTGSGVFSAAFTEKHGVRELFENAAKFRGAAEEAAVNGAALTLIAAALDTELEKDPEALTRKGLKDCICDIADAVCENTAQCGEKELAESFGFSYSYFSRSFKSAVGMSFNEYVNFVRINEAKRVLLSENADIASLARTLGYSSASHFINNFRKSTGISPGQYKKTFREKAI